MNVVMERELKVGDRVRSNPDHAWLYPGPWGEKLAKDRGGVIVEVPLAAKGAGEGTVLVEWDSLHGEKGNPEDWRIWICSSIIKREGTP